MSEYHKISVASDDGDLYQEHHETTCKCPRPSRSRNLFPWIWCSLCTVITVFAVLRTTILPSITACGTEKHPTDFISAPELPLVTKEFYNYYDFNPWTHTLELNRTLHDSDDFKMYAGFPSPEIDNAWDELLGGVWLGIDEEEAAAVQTNAPWPLEPLGDDGHVYTEIGVFHDLHCVNLVRKALNPEYYNLQNDFTKELVDLLPAWGMLHVYHCIDQLRQTIQCASDMTPAPLFTSRGLEKTYYLGHSTPHTCRDFEAVKRWRDERNEKMKPFNAW